MCEHFSAAFEPIKRVYFSPCNATAGVGEYLKDDFSRKSHTEMILQAQAMLDLDLASSVLIGNKASDILAGVAAGVGRNLLSAAQRLEELEGLAYEIITRLPEALLYLPKIDSSSSVQ